MDVKLQFIMATNSLPMKIVVVCVCLSLAVDQVYSSNIESPGTPQLPQHGSDKAVINKRDNSHHVYDNHDNSTYFIPDFDSYSKTQLYALLVDILEKLNVLEPKAPSCYELKRIERKTIDQNEPSPQNLLGVYLYFKESPLVSDSRSPRAESSGLDGAGTVDSESKISPSVKVNNECVSEPQFVPPMDAQPLVRDKTLGNNTGPSTGGEDRNGTGVVVGVGVVPGGGGPNGEYQSNQQEEEGEERFGGLSKTQVVVISTCSAIISTFFIVAAFLRVRNYMKRVREEQQQARRPTFRSCSVRLRSASHSTEQVRRDSQTSKLSHQSNVTGRGGGGGGGVGGSYSLTNGSCNSRDNSNNSSPHHDPDTKPLLLVTAVTEGGLACQGQSLPASLHQSPSGSQSSSLQYIDEDQRSRKGERAASRALSGEDSEARPLLASSEVSANSLALSPTSPTSLPVSLYTGQDVGIRGPASVLSSSPASLRSEAAPSSEPSPGGVDGTLTDQSIDASVITPSGKGLPQNGVVDKMMNGVKGSDGLSQTNVSAQAPLIRFCGLTQSDSSLSADGNQYYCYGTQTEYSPPDLGYFSTSEFINGMNTPYHALHFLHNTASYYNPYNIAPANAPSVQHTEPSSSSSPSVLTKHDSSFDGARANRVDFYRQGSMDFSKQMSVDLGEPSSVGFNKQTSVDFGKQCSMDFSKQYSMDCSKHSSEDYSPRNMENYNSRSSMDFSKKFSVDFTNQNSVVSDSGGSDCDAVFSPSPHGTTAEFVLDGTSYVTPESGGQSPDTQSVVPGGNCHSVVPAPNSRPSAADSDKEQFLCSEGKGQSSLNNMCERDDKVEQEHVHKSTEVRNIASVTPTMSFPETLAPKTADPTLDTVPSSCSSTAGSSFGNGKDQANVDQNKTVPGACDHGDNNDYQYGVNNVTKSSDNASSASDADVSCTTKHLPSNTEDLSSHIANPFSYGKNSALDPVGKRSTTLESVANLSNLVLAINLASAAPEPEYNTSTLSPVSEEPACIAANPVSEVPDTCSVTASTTLVATDLGSLSANLSSNSESPVSESIGHIMNTGDNDKVVSRSNYPEQSLEIQSCEKSPANNESSVLGDKQLLQTTTTLDKQCSVNTHPQGDGDHSHLPTDLHDPSAQPCDVNGGQVNQTQSDCADQMLGHANIECHYPKQSGGLDGESTSTISHPNTETCQVTQNDKSDIPHNSTSFASCSQESQGDGTDQSDPTLAASNTPETMVVMNKLFSSDDERTTFL